MDAPFANRLLPELLLAITTFTDQSTIFRLVAVCRYWRNVLIGTATLWASVDCRKVSRTSILLQRSKSSPIDVTIDSFVPEAISLVAGHTHRMRSIDVNLPSHRFGDVLPLLDGLAPMLQTMRMRRREESSPIEHLPLYSSLFRGQFPALRTLHLDGYPLDPARSAPVITSGLTTLILDNGQHYHPHYLFEYLEHCKNLVYLKIDLPDLEEIIPASRIVALPNLRELRSVLSPLTALQHLSFPPSTNLIIGPRFRKHLEAPPPTAVWTQDALPQLFESRAIKGIRVAFDASNCLVALSGPHLVFMEQVKAHSSRHNSFHSDCLDSLRSLPITAAEDLALLQSPRRPFTGILRQQSCTRLLLQMPELKRIVLDTSVVLPFARALEWFNGQVPCPKLQSLVVIRREGHENRLQNRLLSLSNRRKDHGCPLVCDVGSPGLSNWWQESIRLERIV